MENTRIIDPRIKLTILPVIGFVSFFLKDTVLLFPLVIFAAFLFCYSRMYKKALYYTFFFTILLLIENFMCYSENPQAVFVIYMILYFLSRMLVISIFGMYITKTTGVSEMTEALNKMKIPRSISVSFSVLLRFIPTMRYEKKFLKENMKIRGVINGRFFMFLHPVKYTEYTLVPLLMRMIKISDELSASALIRGLDSGEKRVTIVELRIKNVDLAVLSLGIFAVIAAIIMQINIV